MTKYDFFIAGRWRNKDNILPVLDAVRASGKTAYCFLENTYEGERLSFDINDKDAIEATMVDSEQMSVDDPMIQKIFRADMDAERAADNFVVVFPAGLNAHVEAGVAYGLGKKCYAVGKPEKTETLYCLFDRMFPDLESFKTWLTTEKA